MIPRALHLRLAWVLFALLAIAGAVFVASTLATTHRYQQEVDATLHRDLAWTIAMSEHGALLAGDGSTRVSEIEELFHWLMVVNPRVEVYLLDSEGNITSFSAPAGVVVQQHVDLGPVLEAIDGEGSGPILGDDPRRPERRTIFSAAPLPVEGPTLGYLYIVLASQQAESAAARFRGSYALRLGLFAGLGGLLLAALFGFLFFRRLTSRLRKLAEAMCSMGGADGCPPGETRDEIVRLENAFEHMRERMADQMAERERLDRLRRELIANVSHDLRTPLASLQGYLETLALKGDALTARQRSTYLTTALRQAERLGKRVRELFEFTRLETAASVLECERFSIAELVQDNIQRFALQANDQGVELGASLDASLPWVEGDLGLIERVLENLLENALRYTQAGGRVSIELAAGTQAVTVRVRDTGCGIDPEHLPFIFDRFYRQREGGDSAGAGLGLAISQRILALHRSRLEVESEVGTGTCFRFELPRAGRRMAEPPSPWPSPPTAGGEGIGVGGGTLDPRARQSGRVAAPSPRGGGSG